jgi:hypothetical protein
LAKIDAERKAQSAQTAKNLGNALTDNATMAQDFYNQLIAGGMEQGRAEELKREAMVKMGNQLRDVLNGGTAQTRLDALTGSNTSKDWMDNILKLQSKPGSVSTGGSFKSEKKSTQNPNKPTQNDEGFFKRVADNIGRSVTGAPKDDELVYYDDIFRKVAAGDESLRTELERLTKLSGFDPKKGLQEDIDYWNKNYAPQNLKTPSTPNIQAPNININTPNVPSSSAKTVTYKIEFGGKSLELAGDPSQQNLMNDFLSELEQLNRAR